MGFNLAFKALNEMKGTLFLWSRRRWNVMHIIFRSFNTEV